MDEQNGVSQIAKITASDGAAGDRFGISVAIAGNVVVVGADQKESVYIFMDLYGNGHWTEMTQLTPSDGEVVDKFG
jgi:hypothetical protein